MTAAPGAHGPGSLGRPVAPGGWHIQLWFIPVRGGFSSQAGKCGAGAEPSSSALSVGHDQGWYSQPATPRLELPCSVLLVAGNTFGNTLGTGRARGRNHNSSSVENPPSPSPRPPLSEHSAGCENDEDNKMFCSIIP